MRGFIAERSFGHFEAKAEAPRASAVQSLEQRVGPQRIEQLLLRRCHHDVLDEVLVFGRGVRPKRTYALLDRKNGPVSIIVAVHFSGDALSCHHLVGPTSMPGSS